MKVCFLKSNPTKEYQRSLEVWFYRIQNDWYHLYTYLSHIQKQGHK